MTNSRPDGASAYLRGLVPPRAALWLAVALISALMVCSVIPVYVGGMAALLAFVMGAVCGMNSAVADVSLSWKALTGILAAGAAGLGLQVADQPLLAGVAVMVVGLLQAPLNARAAALGIFLPVLVSIFAMVDVPYGPLVLGAWVLTGFVAIHWLAQLFGLPVVVRVLPMSVAWRHAAVFAIAAGVIQYLMMQWDVPHGYWLVLTLASVLRPVVGETRGVAIQRIGGTFAGVMLAILIVWLVPEGVAVLLVIPCGVLMIAWAVMQDLRKQTMFGTPVVILIASAGAVAVGFEFALERLVLTVLGVLIAAGAVVVLQFIERRTA